MLEKSFAGLNRKLAKLIALLLFVNIIAMIVFMTPAAEATVVNPMFSLNPTSGAVGSAVVISGTGFSPREPATFIVSNEMFAPAMTADADGHINGATTVPDLAAGTYIVTAYDSSGMHYSTDIRRHRRRQFFGFAFAVVFPYC